jgi:aminoglycoside phosphotransferase (APT) family kinase protein
LPERYDDFLQHEIPLEPEEIRQLREFAPRLAELCEELAAHGIPETIQHDDLHLTNLYVQGDALRVLDWGDSSIAHPFFSLFETFRFLEGVNGLAPGDPWFPRLRDAYLEPWGTDLVETFDLALRVGAFAHAIAWMRQRDHLSESEAADFDTWFPLVLRRAVAQTVE